MVANSDNTDQIFLREPSDLDYLFALSSLTLKSLNQIKKRKANLKILFLRLNSQEQYPYRIYGQSNMFMAVPSTHEYFHIAVH